MLFTDDVVLADKNTKVLKGKFFFNHIDKREGFSHNFFQGRL